MCPRHLLLQSKRAAMGALKRLAAAVGVLERVAANVEAAGGGGLEEALVAATLRRRWWRLGEEIELGADIFDLGFWSGVYIPQTKKSSDLSHRMRSVAL
jgi:hypothetical protein